STFTNSYLFRIIMPRPNAKSRVASSKTRNKAGVFVANPKDIEKNIDIPKD
ncbi:11583_t:CDS:1, partial [Gigaspora margarita]